MTKVGSVDNALAIITLLAQSTTPLRLMDISQRLSINNSTCLSILRTLLRHQVLILDPKTKRYAIGSYITDIHDLLANKDDQDRQLEEMMASIARDFQVLATVWTKTDDRTLTLTAAFESNRDMRIFMELGQTRPLYFGSIGRVFAAQDSITPEKLEREISRYKWNVVPSFADYNAQVEATRSNGWSVDYGYAVLGMTSVSVPLTRPGRELTQCFCAGMFNLQYDDAAFRKKLLDRMIAVSNHRPVSDADDAMG